VGELVAALHGVGLVDGRIVAEFDPFLGTSKERTARRYGVIGVSVAARRP